MERTRIETASLSECLNTQSSVNEMIIILKLLDEVISIENKIKLLTIIKEEKYEELKRARVQDRYTYTSSDCDYLPYHKR